MARTTQVNRRRTIGIAATLAAGTGAAGLAAAGCGVGQPAAQSQAPVTVHALLDPSLITLFGETAPVIPTFKEANPKVTLDLEAGPGPTDGNLGMINKFRAKVAAGEALDVYAEVPSDQVAGFAKQGLLRDLGPMMARQKVVAVKDYWPAVMGTVTYQSKLYALPYQVFTELVYYNEDLLQREGQPIPTKDWTWDKLLEVAKAVTRPGSEGRPGQWGIVLGLGNFRGLALPIMWAWGGKLFDDDTNPKSLSLDPAGAEGLQWLADMYTKYRVVAQQADATAVGQTNPNNMVGAGPIAFNYSSLTWRGYRQHQFKSDVQMLPKGKARSAASTWGGCLTMPSVTKAPDAALALMTHISGPAGQKLMIPVVDQFPSVESIATSPEWLKFDRFNRQAAVDMIRQAKPTPPTPAWPDINSQALSPLYTDLINGRKSALDGLREIKPKVDDLLRTMS
jgi:ABC-type glycerol-3-phosphate transport system substrate-binding protein